MPVNFETKQKILHTLNQLPPEGLEELARYLDFLRSKYHVHEPLKVVALGGVWKDLGFDVTEEEVRTLRERVTRRVLERT